MSGQETYVFQGKEFTVWKEAQLLAINRAGLKNRCMDIRDHIGADRLPPMPRHPEEMIKWMLHVQKIVMQGGGQGDDSDDDQSSRAPQRRGGPPDAQEDRGYGGPPQDERGPPYAQEDRGYGGPPQGARAAWGPPPQEDRGYGGSPQGGRGYTPSDAGSQACSYAGKEVSLWTEGQLMAINRGALKNRCLDIRDRIGQDRLPPMPRHPEGMVAWLLKVQNMMQGGRLDDDNFAARPPSAQGRMGGGGGYPGQGGQMQPQSDRRSGYGGSDAGSVACSEAQQVFLDAKAAANAIRIRNQGGSGGIW